MNFADIIEIFDENSKEVLAPIPIQPEGVIVDLTWMQSKDPRVKQVISNFEPILIDSEDEEEMKSILPKDTKLHDTASVLKTATQAGATEEKMLQSDVASGISSFDKQELSNDESLLNQNFKSKDAFELVEIEAEAEKVESLPVVSGDVILPQAYNNEKLATASTQTMKEKSVDDLLNEIDSCIEADSKEMSSSPIDIKGKLEHMIRECSNREKSEDLEQLIKKLNKHFNRVEEEFKQSQELHDSFIRTCEQLKQRPDWIYIHLKDFFELLKFHRQDDTEVETEQPTQIAQPKEEIPKEKREAMLEKLKKAFTYLGNKDEDRTDDDEFWKRYHQVISFHISITID
jgi:hypothetical protein